VRSNGTDVHERLWRARRFIDNCYDLPLDLEISSLRDIDDEVKRWLKVAYEGDV